jgi:hypothetical protein
MNINKSFLPSIPNGAKISRRVKAIIGTTKADSLFHIPAAIDYADVTVDSDGSQGLVAPLNFVCYINVTPETRAVPIHGLGATGSADVIWAVDGSIL